MVDRGETDVRVGYGTAEGGETDGIPPALADEEAVAVDRIAGIEHVRTVEDPACLVLAVELSVAPAFVRAVRDRWPDLPIVLYPPEPDPAGASDALRAGATDYLPRSIDEEGTKLVDTVLEAVERYADRRTRRARSELFADVMETAPLGISFKDRGGRYVAASSYVESGAGETVLGRTDPEIWGPTGLQNYEDDLRVLETGEPTVGKLYQYDFAGEPIWMRASKFPWRDENDEIRGVIGFEERVTDLKRRELELERRVSRLEAFASFVSHDLRNPLTIARGYAELAKTTDDRTEIEGHIQEVEASLERMSELIDDMLTMARPDSDGSATRFVDLSRVAEESWTSLDADAATLHVEILDETTIAAVEGQLRQLFTNLFRNAIDHAGPEVDVVVGRTEDGFYVADDGPGIDADDPDEIFEYGRTRGGTGVGLTIVREVARAHEWTVTAGESESGGARFEFGDCEIQRPVFLGGTETTSVRLSATADVGDATPPGEIVGGGTDSSDGSDSGDGTDGGNGDRRWIVRGGGRNLWRGTDEHYFAYAAVEPPVSVIATVAGVEPVHGYAKAGLMVRDDPASGTPFGYLGLTPGYGTEFGWRTEPDDEIAIRSYSEYEGEPRRYRVDYLDSRLTGYVSTADGWVTIDQQSVRTADSVAAGLAVCSHDADRRCEAVFEDVRVLEYHDVES